MNDANLQEKLISLDKELRALKTKQGYVSIEAASFLTLQLGAGEHTIQFDSLNNYPVVDIAVAGSGNPARVENLRPYSTYSANMKFTLTATATVYIVSTGKILSVT